MAPKGEKRTYVCTCTLRCKGNKLVSKATYYGHKAFRLLDAATQTRKQGTASPTPRFSGAGTGSAEHRTTPARDPIPSDVEESDSGTDTQPLRKRTLEEVDYGDGGRSQDRIDAARLGGDEQARRRRRIDEEDEMPRDDDMDIYRPDGDYEQPDDWRDPYEGNADPGSLADIERRDRELNSPDGPSNMTNPPPRSPSLRPDLDDQEGGPIGESLVEDIRISQAFIDELRDASLDNSGLSEEVLERLRNPIEGPPDVDDPDIRLAIRFWIESLEVGQDNYHKSRNAVLERHPDDLIPTYHQIQRIIAEQTGVGSIVDHMCVNSCIAYTGPYSALDECPHCHESRYDQIAFEASGGTLRKPRRTFHTIPLGPQLQALWRTPSGAENMQYRSRRTDEILEDLEANNGVNNVYEDFLHGSDYLEAVVDGHITSDDMVLLLSIDGAQLYASKQSDCWIYIWVVLDHSPDIRYKKKYVLVGGFIPGPHNPKDVDSYVFPGLLHLAGLQKEGLRVWDALRNRVFTSRPFLAFVTGDGPGIAHLSGLVGPNGAYGCRLYCDVKGRRKAGEKRYYPALQKPDNYAVSGCDHDDILPRDISGGSAEEYDINLTYLRASRNVTQLKKNRTATGISKPSIISGLPQNRTLGIPGSFPLDLMHLASLNIPDLLLNLWRGTLDCDSRDDKSSWDWAVLEGDVWQKHGVTVANATPYLPGSFDRPPRNPAEKISSRYKAWEFLLYVFGLGPGLLYGILPRKYWRHFCKLVSAMRLSHQRSLTREELIISHQQFLEFHDDFETLYCQRKAERLHFARPSLHTLVHIATEASRAGPLPYYTQWTMERTIGNLGEEIRQPSDPYANLSQCGIRRSQVNALKAMMPDLDPDQDKLPRGALDVGGGFVLLRARDETAQRIGGAEGQAVRAYFEAQDGTVLRPDWTPRIQRWARLRLPNGQIARSRWKESLKLLNQVRMARNVKLYVDNIQEFGEIQFFFRARVNNEEQTLALISVYGPPDDELLEESYDTLWACRYHGEDNFQVVNAKQLLSVVAMVPFTPPAIALDGEELGEYGEEWYFVVEKPGLEVFGLREDNEEQADEE